MGVASHSIRANRTMNSLAFLLLRLMFGLGLAWHGFQTLFLSEVGVERLAGMLTDQEWPMPTAMAYAAKLGELLCGLMVALGLFTRWAALVCAFVMGVAVAMTANWVEFSSYELAGLYCIAFVAILFTGAGTISLDQLRINAKRRAAALDDDELLDEEMPDTLGNAAPVVDSLDHSPPPIPAAGSTSPAHGRSGE
jgi:putative oxidoreductase